MTRGWVITLVLALTLATPYFLVTFYVIPPIGALPEGKTIVIWKRAKTKFIDSPDALCAREMGGVSLFCRATALAVIGKDGENILLRLPYSEWLYLISTEGKVYGQ